MIITLKAILSRLIPYQEKVDELKRKYKFKYSSDELNIPAKMTVTEIVSNEREEELGEQNPEFYPQLPRLYEEITKLTCIRKGYIIHIYL